MAECKSLDLGDGTNSGQPCTTILGVPVCGPSDFVRVRRALQVEYGALVARLNWWNGKINEVINGKKIGWWPIATASWDLSAEALRLLEKYPESILWDLIKNTELGYYPSINAMAKMAAQVHCATADMDGEIQALGLAVPQTPPPPPPPAKITDPIRDAAKGLAQAGGYVALGLAAVAGGIYLLRNSGNSAGGGKAT